MYETCTEPREAEIAGHKVNYIYATSPMYDENGQPADESFAMLIMYADTIRNSTILVSCTSAQATDDLLPTEETLAAEAEQILSCLQLP